MSFKAIYHCDLCHEETLKGNLRGLRFTNLREFVLSDPEHTQGTHICIACLEQLRDQLKGSTRLVTRPSARGES